MNRPKEVFDREKLIFALDIGTRSVTGVVGVPENGVLRVLGVETEEHAGRAVVDGQIEDIEQTARIASIVKKRLEDRLGISLSEVYVAAAGRVLKTRRVSCTLELDEKKAVGQDELFRLESRAIQQAYDELLAEQEPDSALTFYCVGHSVIRYTLDGYAFSTLLNHRGRQAQVELIATFLPSEVVESLYEAMQQTGLTIMSITLEPIAAINAVIPQELRLLNIALVDVGAGTSDIAVTNNGSVCAYTMATMAGDEITEKAMREFLVDFQMAEKMKFMLSEGREQIPYCDILGFEYSITLDELRTRLLPAVEELAQTISLQILETNGAPPMAVFMVGGGSRTPELCGMVAKNLSIDEKKVAIGGSNYMKRMVDTEPQYVSAEYATPIGIAISAMSAQNQENLSVSINGKRVRMMRAGAMTLLEALLRAGYQYGQIMGRSGKSVTFELNGERRIARGTSPTLAEFEVNGHPANITTPLDAGDTVRFVPAANGEDACPTPRSLDREWESFEVTVDGEVVTLGSCAIINGVNVSGDAKIQEGDKVRLWQARTLGALLELTGGSLEGMSVNGNARIEPGLLLKAGDRILTGAAASVQAQQPVLPPVQEPSPSSQEQKPSAAPPPSAEQQEPAPQAAKGPLHIRLNGEQVLLPAKQDGSPTMFFDVLNYVEIDLENPAGEPVIRRNGRAASYIEQIQDGDQIEIFWG